MDGNGRWAQAQGWQRDRGHDCGAGTVRRIATESAELGIERLTLYAFSSENWSRPQAEVDFLMALLVRFLDQELPTLQDNGIRLSAIGRLGELPDVVQAKLHDVIAATASNNRMNLCLALAYGGRQELVDSMQTLARAVKNGELQPEDIDEAAIGAHLYAPDASDVDLVIRTAQEQRLSNFLPWQSIYAEYYSASAFWPEFSEADYHQALQAYASRSVGSAKRLSKSLHRLPKKRPVDHDSWGDVLSSAWHRCSRSCRPQTHCLRPSRRQRY